MKIMPVFGTRPEAIKLAPVILLARRQPERFQLTVCVTGQHRQMLDQMLAVFGIAPDIDLDLMRPEQTLADISARTLTGVAGVLERQKPDWVLVQGDTTTVWAAALAAFFAGVRVGHVEAGLRTGDKQQPFPEEVNRRIATQVADVHFAPTEWARGNLLREGVAAETVVVTGNTVIDALYWMLERNEKAPGAEVREIERWSAEQVGERALVLVTGHRRESFGQGFEDICEALAELASRHGETCWVYPVHLNPKVQAPVRRILGGVENVFLIEPLGYAAFTWLMKRALFILTDSGGVQEEAPSLGKRVLVMRRRTERPEGVEAGVVKLVGNERGSIVAGCEELLAMGGGGGQVVSPYGDGQAAGRILRALEERG